MMMMMMIMLNQIISTFKDLKCDAGDWDGKKKYLDR